MLFFIFMLIVAIGFLIKICADYSNSRRTKSLSRKCDCASEENCSKNDNFKIDSYLDGYCVKTFTYSRKTKNGMWVKIFEIKHGTRYKDKNGKWDFINLKNMSEDEIKYALVNMTEGVKKIRSIEDYNLLPLKTEIIKEKQKSDLEEWDERFNERIQTKEI